MVVYMDNQIGGISMLLDDLSNEELFNHVRSRNLLLERNSRV